MRKILLIISFTFILFLMPQITNAFVINKINFAVNKDYAAQNPDWKARASEVIDFANQVFAKTTDVRFVINEFITFDIENISQRKFDDKYYSLNNYDDYLQAATIFFWQPLNSEEQTIVDDLAALRNFRFYYEFQNYSIDNRPAVKYKLDYLSINDPEMEYFNILKGSSYLNNKYGDYNFERYAAGIVHELGHIFGLSSPDMYLYQETYDNTGISPLLEQFDPIKRYGNDPMIYFDYTAADDFKFNSLNSFIINQNKNYQYTYENHYFYTRKFSSNVAVKAVDINGNPLPGITVNVYGARDNCSDCYGDPKYKTVKNPLLQSLQTDINGQVLINPTAVNTYVKKEFPENTGYISKIVKVYDGNRAQAKYFTSYDLQKNKILNNSDSFEINFIFDLRENNDNFAGNLKGRILLQVEDLGQAWYVYPDNFARYYLGKPDQAFDIMKRFGLGIKSNELNNYINSEFPQRLSGKILLDVEQNGEAYYIYPADLQAYYLGRPQDAFNLMRNLGLGISNNDLQKIKIGQ